MVLCLILSQFLIFRCPLEEKTLPMYTLTPKGPYTKTATENSLVSRSLDFYAVENPVSVKIGVEMRCLEEGRPMKG